MTPSILDDVMFCADAVPAIVSTRARMTPIEREIMEVSLLFFTGAGAPPPARAFADTSPRIYTSSAPCGRRRFFTGAGAPPPARPIADASPRIHLSSARRGRRRFWSLALLFAWTRTSQAVQVDSVHLVDDLGKRAHRRFKTRFRNESGRVQIRVIDRMIDDVKAGGIREDDSQFAAGPRLGPGVDRDAERLEALCDNRLELIAAADEPAACADGIRSDETVPDQVRLNLRGVLAIDDERCLREHRLQVVVNPAQTRVLTRG